MPRVFLGSLALCVFAVACGGPGAGERVAGSDAMTAPQATDELEEAPDFTIATLGGDTFTLSDGELPTVLNFWAPW